MLGKVKDFFVLKRSKLITSVMLQQIIEMSRIVVKFCDRDGWAVLNPIFKDTNRRPSAVVDTKIRIKRLPESKMLM